MSYKWRVMIATVFGISMFLIDTTVVNVALAKLQGVFSVDVATVQWVITGYALASGVATPLAGYATSRWGTKRVWLIGLIVFASASMLRGLSLAFGDAYRYTFFGALIAIVLALFLPGRQKSSIDPSMLAGGH
jgi:MFS family permease